MKPDAGKFKAWLDSPDGEYVIRKLLILIDNNHEHAENEPENARDYMQRAKGVREAVTTIRSLAATARKPHSREELIAEHNRISERTDAPE